LKMAWIFVVVGKDGSVRKIQKDGKLLEKHEGARVFKIRDTVKICEMFRWLQMGMPPETDFKED